MTTTVIHHSADFDGLFCREIARKFLPEAELIGWDFGDPVLDRDHLLSRDKVYIMDLPVDKPLGLNAGAIMETQNRKWVSEHLVWIDHHKSSIESHSKDTPGYRIDGVAACRLAWQWFTRPKEEAAYPIIALSKDDFIDRKVDEPLAVRLAGEYDVWDKRDPRAELFQHGLRSQELTAGDWADLLDTTNPLPGVIGVAANLVAKLIDQGECLQYARAKEYEEVITQQGFDVKFEGLKFLACNSHELDIRSHLFVEGIRNHHQALLGFTWGGHDWRVSMYHAPGNEHHDLSVIATKYGGGGHRGACGFRCKKLPFQLTALNEQKRQGTGALQDAIATNQP